MNVSASVEAYIDVVSQSRSPNTARTYRNALSVFTASLRAHHVNPDTRRVSQASEDWIGPFAHDLKAYAPASERLYLTAVSGWYEWLSAERLASVNLPRVRQLIRMRARRPGVRLPQFERKAIEAIIDYAIGLAGRITPDKRGRLRLLRDKAFLLTLADTGLRVHEACGLRRGDVDWDEAHALLIGKGDRQAIVRFSTRALRAIREYLHARAAQDGGANRSLAALPLFARHDRGSGTKILPITTTTGRSIVHEHAIAALGKEEARAITPHSFRHYFVTAVLRGSGGNLKLAQELARHRNIAVTQRYAHLSQDELDRGYYEIFDRG
jgi:site-specific recombinase XerD